MLIALLLGIVQGLTEFIPVSSSGHLVLFHELFNLKVGGLAFDVALHVGTLLAVVIYFWSDIIEILKGLWKKNQQSQQLAQALIIATLPAVLAGFFFESIVSSALRSPWVVVVMLAVFGFVMLYAEERSTKIKTKNDAVQMSSNKALKMGVFQALALIPGVSRSGATISGGLLLGFDRVSATRFSFLMSLPVIFGASVKILLNESARLEITNNQWLFGVGFLTAFISGSIAIRFLIKFVSRYSIRVFAYYRLAIAAIMALLLIMWR